MGKSKLYDCLQCEGSNSVCVETNVDSEGIHVLVKKCKKCFQFHNINSNGTLEKYHIDDTNLSHSPTEPDVLVDGYWFIGTEEDYRMVAKLVFGSQMKRSVFYAEQSCLHTGFMAYYNRTLSWQPCDKKTQLTAPEFIRRAENTFKTK